jgi:hypothetical protein
MSYKRSREIEVYVYPNTTSAFGSEWVVNAKLRPLYHRGIELISTLK